MIKSNLKPILDEKNISIRKLSNDIDHGFNTVRKLYHDVLERYQRELLVKVFTSVDI
ncbi:XRE family transcriptional regulator, partial [Bacillus velezensis]